MTGAPEKLQKVTKMKGMAGIGGTGFVMLSERFSFP